MTTTTIDGKTKASMSLRDWGIFFVALIGGVLWLEHRFQGIELRAEKQDVRIEQCQAANSKMDKLVESVYLIQVDVGVLRNSAERARR